MSGSALVIGLRRSGLACVRALHDEGYAVTAIDGGDAPDLKEIAATLPADVAVRLGPYADDVAVGFDMVCPSPGVPWDAPVLEAARRAGVAVRSEIDLFMERCPARIVAITGTNGKTTTTALTAAVLAASGVPTHRGGNIGETVLDRVSQMSAGDWVVLELSSFQIESLLHPKVEIGCVLNITPDHLDRHATLENYAAIKARIAAVARSAAVLNHDDPLTRDMASLATASVLFFGRDLDGHDGATVVGDAVVSVDGGRMTSFMSVAEIPLYGAHNVDNVLAAVSMGRAAGVALDAIAAAVRGFLPVEHRLQPVRDEDGVLWINDSKATNVDAAVKALNSFGDRPIVWIGGGSYKGVGPTGLANAVAERARVAILYGATGSEMDGALAARGFEPRHLVVDLRAAVARAREVAQPGDVVLLAPGYASFDQFKDYEERGRVFAALVGGVAHPVTEEV